MWQLARSNAAAHKWSLAGTGVVVALATALLTTSGVLLESGLRSLDDATSDAGALSAMAASFIGTAIVVVVLVVASTASLAMRPRQRDLAVFRALGATRTQVRRMVADEMLLVSALAAPVGAVPGIVGSSHLTPILVDAGVVSPGFELVVSPWPVLGAVMLVAAIVVAAAYLATRSTLMLPPTAAVQASIVEPRDIGRGRRTAAYVAATAGLVSACTPFLASGTVGGAAAASSALLLIGAAALAGPVLVAHALRPSSTTDPSRFPSLHLALANGHGLSRRLTAVVIPFAAALAVGTMHTTTANAVGDAAAQQLVQGLRADVAVTAPEGLSSGEVEDILTAAGTTASAELSTLPIRVRTDDEDVPGLESLSWEGSQARVLSLDGPEASYDPDVIEGALVELTEPDSVAISSDVRLFTGARVGDSLTVQLDGGNETDLRVVAVYDRGLGFGDYTLGAATPREHGLHPPIDTMLISATRPDEVVRDLRAAGHEAMSTRRYVELATSAVAGEQRLSSVLVLALLGFMLVGAANALVMLTSGRRDELDLLHRIGATRRQLIRMAWAESLVTALLASTIGTAAVIPTVLGVSWGLLGPVVPALHIPTYAALVGLVLVLSVLSTVPAVVARSAPSRHDSRPQS